MATTEIYTYDTLFPYPTLFRSEAGRNDERRLARDREFVGSAAETTTAAASCEQPRHREPGGNRHDLTHSHSPQKLAISAFRAPGAHGQAGSAPLSRSEEHTSELQSLMRKQYDVFCLKKQQQ